MSTCYNRAFRRTLGPLDDLIRKYALILSGSSVPATILGDRYPGSDFDIYTFAPFKMRNENEVDSEFDDEVVEKLGGVLVLTSSYRNTGNHNYKYICPNFIINVINVPVKSKFEIYDYIHRSTDIDICASIYNGYDVRFPHHLLERKAKTINKQLILEIDKLPKDPTMTDDQWDVEKQRLKEIFVLKRTTRATKYIERGFDLETDLPITDYSRYTAHIFLRRQSEIESSIHYKLICLAKLTRRNVEAESNFVLIDYDSTTLTSRIIRNETVANSKCRVEPGKTFRRLDYDTLKWVRVWVRYFKL